MAISDKLVEQLPNLTIGMVAVVMVGGILGYMSYSLTESTNVFLEQSAEHQKNMVDALINHTDQSKQIMAQWLKQERRQSELLQQIRDESVK